MNLPDSEFVDRIDVMGDEPKIKLNPEPVSQCEQHNDDAPDSLALTLPWSKSLVRKRKGLMSNETNNDAQHSMRGKTKARLLKGFTQARIWLDCQVSDQTADIDRIATELGLAERTVRSTLTLAPLAPDAFDTTIDGDLLRGIIVGPLTDLTSDWQEQHGALVLI